MMPAAHKGSISFGLVNIPIEMRTTTQENDVHFNQLCKKTHERIRYKKFCPHCNTEVKNDDIVKGYQYDKDKYVILTDEELEKIKTEQDRSIHILKFVDLKDIDDLYYEKNFFAVPQKGAEKAYALLNEAMLQSKKVAIAKTVIKTKENLLALCPRPKGMIIKSLYFEDELLQDPRPVSDLKLNKNEMAMAKTLIDTMSDHFQPEEYKDEYQARLRNAIERKIAGQNIVKAKSKKEDSAADLMDALKKSLEQAPKKTKAKTKRTSV